MQFYTKLVQVLSETVADGRVVSLVRKYLVAGAMAGGVREETRVGVPQGGPLSPLLANVMLNELDWELDRRGHRFVRYADDCMVFCKSRKAAQRTLESITRFIEGRLRLKVNREKTCVARFNRVRYLGYAFYRFRGECRFRVHPDSVRTMRDRVRELTGRSKGIPNDVRPLMVSDFVRGWVSYFRLADMKKLLREVDEWMRRRIRMAYWKQWKRVRTRFRMLQRCGIERERAWMFANTRKGYWRVAASPVMTKAIRTEQLACKGYLFFSTQYERVHVC